MSDEIKRPDDILFVNFYMRSMPNEFESEKQGRPIYFEAPFIRIMTPGDQLNIIDTFVREEHKIRFPRQWAIFQNSQNSEELQLIGTPLSQWPAITRSHAEELKGAKFFTVEQIANASDLQKQSLGMNANVLVQKAQAFLTVALNTALAQQQATELLHKDEQIAELKTQMDKLLQQFQTFSQAQSLKKKPGRPKKIIQTEPISPQIVPLFLPEQRLAPDYPMKEENIPT